MFKEIILKYTHSPQGGSVVHGGAADRDASWEHWPHNQRPFWQNRLKTDIIVFEVYSLIFITKSKTIYLCHLGIWIQLEVDLGGPGVQKMSTSGRNGRQRASWVWCDTNQMAVLSFTKQLLDTLSIAQSSLSLMQTLWEVLIYSAEFNEKNLINGVNCHLQVIVDMLCGRI